MFHDKPFLQSFVKRKKNAFIQHTIRGLWSYPFLQPFLQPIFPFLQRPILFSVYYPRWLISRPCIDDKMHPVCHFYGKLIANLFVLLLIRKLWRQMFFDKLCKLLTTGLSLFAGELHNLLNIERIVMHLVI